MSTNTTIKQDWYPNGQLKEYTLYEGTQLANGWSYKLYHANGQLKQQDCYSHGQLIEQQTFDEAGNKTAHTIWNHRLQQMVERPVVTPARNTQRPNVASGCMTIYSIAEIMPLVAELIEAPDQSEEMLKAHDQYYGYSDNEDEQEENVWDDEGEDSEAWTVQGLKGRLSVIFERYEGYLFYHIHTPDNTDYEKARQLVERAQNRYRLHRYLTEEELAKLTVETGKPVLYYIAPYHNRTCLETELTVWGSDPVYTLLQERYILSIHRIEENTNSRPRETGFLAAVPNWESMLQEARHANTVFYIVRHLHTNKYSMVRDPSPTELEDFLRDNNYRD